MPDLKPTTPEERERWSAVQRALGETDSQILRLIADVERLRAALDSIRFAAHHGAIDNRFGDKATRYLYGIEKEAREALDAND